MATKSKLAAETAAPTRTAGLDVAARIAAEQVELYEAAEQFLTLRAAGTPDNRDGTVYAGLKWEPPTIQANVERAGAVSRWKDRAGTAAVRAATDKTLADARELERTETPKLLADKQLIDDRLAELQRATRLATAAQFTRVQAVAVLRDMKMLPDHIQMRLRLDRSAADHPDRNRLRPARERVKAIDRIIALRPADHGDAVRLHCVSNPDVGDTLRRWANSPSRGSPGSPSPTTAEVSFPQVDWDKYIEKLGSEREQVVALIAELEPADRERQGEYDSLLDYHVAKIG